MKLSIQFGLLIVVPVLVVIGPGAADAQQRPFERLQKGWDDIRPRGELLRKIFGEDEPRQPPAQPSGSNVRPDNREPTLADPRGAADLERRRAWASQQQRQQQMREEQIEALQQRQQPLRQLFRVPGQSAPTEPGNGHAPSQANDAPRPPVHGAPERALMPPKEAVPTRALAKGHPMELGIEIVKSDERDDAEGLLINRIDPRGAGALSGLRRGDMIVSVGGIDVHHEGDLKGIIEVMRPGDQIEFRVRRNGKPENVSVQFGDIPDSTGDLNFVPGDDDWSATSSRMGDIANSSSIVRIASSGHDGALKSVLVRE